MEVFNYPRAETRKVLGSGAATNIALKMCSDEGETRWMSITPDQAERIASLLIHDETLSFLEVVCSQCKPGHDRGDGRCERHGLVIG